MCDQKLEFDEVGYWSEIKLDIVREYATAYSTVLSARREIRRHIYIDAFAGAGYHISKRTSEPICGSPVNALHITPPFSELHFVDMDGGRAANLRFLSEDFDSVFVYEGDCNTILPTYILPRARYEDYHRALCLLDPYGLHLDWSIMKTAGSMKSIDIFLNFPVMDMNRTVLWRNPEGVSQNHILRMNNFWGDESWRQVAYRRSPGLFDEIKEKNTNEAIVEAFRNRLRSAGGFDFVPEPMPMRNTRGAIVYYLFFASQKAVANNIIRDIFKKYRDRGT